MRILFLTPQYPPEIGGVSTSLFSLVNAMHSLGHEVRIIISESQEVLPLDYPLQCVTPHDNVDPQKQFFEILRQYRPDVVHIYYAGQFSALVVDMASTFGYKVLVTCQGSDVHRLRERNGKHIDTMLRVFGAADSIVCCSEYLAQILHEFSSSYRCRVIHNWVDPAHIDRIYPHNVNQTYLFSCGRLEPIKGFDSLIEVILHHPQFPRLYIAGGGSQDSILGSLICSLHLEERVQLLGPLENDDIIRWMKGCHVYLQPSRNEGFSIAMVEAMACGVPVIVTPFRSAYECINDGVDGFIRPVQEFPSVISRLLDSPDYRQAIAESAKRKACHFATNTSITQYIQVYSDLFS